MKPNLTPQEPLSQVIFIHDYFQLVFGEEIFSIYNPAELISSNSTQRHGQVGFCDALAQLIGQRAVQDSADEYMLSLSFESGAQFHVLRETSASRGVEAFEFAGNNDLIVVEQNA